MIGVSASIAAVGLVSAFLPAVPIEPYLLGAVAVTGQSAIIAGVAAGVGQTVGKTLMFLGARGVVRWAPLRRWIARRKRPAPDGEPARPRSRRGARLRAALRRGGEVLVAALRRPVLSVPILLLSAVVGFPPLLVVTFYVAGTPMPAWVFSAVCLIGRTARFTAVAAAPHLFT